MYKKFEIKNIISNFTGQLIPLNKGMSVGQGIEIII